MPFAHYLVRYSDRIINRIERITPLRMHRALRLYTAWTLRLGRRKQSLGMKLARKWLLQLTLNILLIAAIFLTAAFLVYHLPSWLPRFNFDTDAVRALYWLAAAVVALPLYVATLRKMQAIGLLIAEVSFSGMPAGARKDSAQTVLANTILFVAIVALASLTALLSSAFLPPWPVVLVLLAIVILIAWFSWRHLVRIYSKLHGALQDALEPDPRQAAGEETPPSAAHAQLATMLRRSALAHIPIQLESPAVYKVLSELKLRTLSGASVVAIERADDSLINPGPSEEIRPDDVLLLLGTEEQIQLARTLLCGDRACGGSTTAAG
jgi:CPA2 family monovalent cation:H+ antiporter-2